MTISLAEAQARLADLLHQLAAGEELVITENDLPIARIVSATQPDEIQPPRKLGTLGGTVLHMAADFDAPLDDFQE